MELNTKQRAGLLQAIDILRASRDKKEANSTDSETVTSWRGKPPIPILASMKSQSEYVGDLAKEGDLDDEEILRTFTEQLMPFLKKYPNLMAEVKNKYFSQ